MLTRSDHATTRSRACSTPPAARSREWTDRLRARGRRRLPGEGHRLPRRRWRCTAGIGKPCPVCGAPVQRISTPRTRRTTAPRCQTGGRLLADRALSRLLKGLAPQHRRVGSMTEPITALIQAHRRGDPDAVDRLYPLVRSELRRGAAALLRRERDAQSVQATNWSTTHCSGCSAPPQTGGTGLIFLAVRVRGARCADPGGPRPSPAGGQRRAAGGNRTAQG